ncbi:MAG: carbohydrate-binding family 9-like protein [Alistipes sp.]|jgi:hypothetical protein|nr:carbohydrate-binding family 9-like protein [Alistipes sp.]
MTTTRKTIIAAALCLVTGLGGANIACAQNTQGQSAPYTIASTEDFTVTGDGSNSAWEGAQWLEMTPRRPAGEGKAFTTRLKAMYSGEGIYFLFDCADTQITATMEADFLDLWTEDVVEVFLMPDESDPTYFEYEISPLNYELPILISNLGGDLTRWMPFHYDADRRVAHQTSVTGGEKVSGASITGWKAEFFIPFKLLRPLNNLPPKKGDTWRANFYRIDRAGEASGSWSWQLTTTNFHDYSSFGTIVFD